MMPNKLEDLLFLFVWLINYFFYLRVHKHENKSNQNSGALRIYIFPRRDVRDGGTHEHFTLNSP